VIKFQKCEIPKYKFLEAAKYNPASQSPRLVNFVAEEAMKKNKELLFSSGERVEFYTIVKGYDKFGKLVPATQCGIHPSLFKKYHNIDYLSHFDKYINKLPKLFLNALCVDHPQILLEASEFLESVRMGLLQQNIQHRNTYTKGTNGRKGLIQMFAKKSASQKNKQPKNEKSV